MAPTSPTLSPLSFAGGGGDGCNCTGGVSTGMIASEASTTVTYMGDEAQG